jgi:nickel-dependent lactate racemase
VRPHDTGSYFGIHGCLFPTFSDTKTILRFRSADSRNGRNNHHSQLAAEVDHVAWLLGINFTTQIVPAANNELLHIVSGHCDSVRQRVRTLYDAAWSCPDAQPAGLVIAAIDGEQSWENVGQALQTAEKFTDADGTIVVCCDLDAAPGPAMQHKSCECHSDVKHHHHHERAPDSIPASQLAHALARYKVYLLSRVDAALVEDLDMVPLADSHELARLAKQYNSCILLSNTSFVTANKS